MNVSLTPELDAWVADRVKSGMYASASEVVREALRLLREQDQVKRARLQELKGLIQEGLDASAAGMVHEGTDALWDGILAAGLAAAERRRR